MSYGAFVSSDGYKKPTVVSVVGGSYVDFDPAATINSSVASVVLGGGGVDSLTTSLDPLRSDDTP